MTDKTVFTKNKKMPICPECHEPIQVELSLTRYQSHGIGVNHKLEIRKQKRCAVCFMHMLMGQTYGDRYLQKVYRQGHWNSDHVKRMSK